VQEPYSVTSVRLPRDLRARFDDLAQMSGRTRTDLIVEAMARYAEAETAFIAAVQEGMDDVGAGRHRSLEEITGEWVQRGLLSPKWQDESSPSDR